MVAFRSGQTRGPPLIQKGGRFAQHQHYALVQASSWGSSYPSESKDTSVLVPCRAPRLTRQDVGRPGMHSFLWRMLRSIMSTQERLHRLSMPNTPLPLCSSCYKEKIDSLKHALLKWSTKKAWLEILLKAQRAEILDMVLEPIKYLDNYMWIKVIWHWQSQDSRLLPRRFLATRMPFCKFFLGILVICTENQ